MPTPYSKEGARLRTQSRMFRAGHYVATTDVDLVQPKCEECGRPISDIRLSWQDAKYCSRPCMLRHCKGSVGRVRTHGVSSGREKRWAGVLDQARTAQGAEIAVSCESKQKASALCGMFRGKRDFDARSDGSTVFVWFVTAGGR